MRTTGIVIVLALALAAVAVLLLVPDGERDGPMLADKSPVELQQKVEGTPPVSSPDAFSAQLQPADTKDRQFLNDRERQEGARMGLIPANARSVLVVEDELGYGEWVWDDEGVEDGPTTIHVDLRRQIVSAFRGGHEIGTSIILYGGEGKETPIGRFPVKAKSETHFSRTYNNAPMPYSLWLTDDGVAMHGSDVRWGRATHGCVGLPLEFARRLFEEAEVGSVVRIVRSDEDLIEQSGIAEIT